MGGCPTSADPNRSLSSGFQRQAAHSEVILQMCTTLSETKSFFPQTGQCGLTLVAQNDFWTDNYA